MESVSLHQFIGQESELLTTSVLCENQCICKKLLRACHSPSLRGLCIGVLFFFFNTVMLFEYHQYRECIHKHLKLQTQTDLEQLPVECLPYKYFLSARMERVTRSAATNLSAIAPTEPHLYLTLDVSRFAWRYEQGLILVSNLIPGQVMWLALDNSFNQSRYLTN